MQPQHIRTYPSLGEILGYARRELLYPSETFYNRLFVLLKFLENEVCQQRSVKRIYLLPERNNVVTHNNKLLPLNEASPMFNFKTSCYFTCFHLALQYNMHLTVMQMTVLPGSDTWQCFSLTTCFHLLLIHICLSCPFLLTNPFVFTSVSLSCLVLVYHHIYFNVFHMFSILVLTFFYSYILSVWFSNTVSLHIKCLDFPTAYKLAYICSIDSCKPPYKGFFNINVLTVMIKIRCACEHIIRLSLLILSS